MKKVMVVGLGCLALIAWVNSQGFAVWPPSTSLQEGGVSASRQDLPLSDRLDEDIRRLDEVLQNLKQDQQELKQSQQKAGAETRPTALFQEDSDGRRLH